MSSPNPVVNSPDTICKFRDAAEAMDAELSASTNLSALDRKILTYWTLATHALPSLGWFPLLALTGPTNTGKSSAETISESYCYRPSKRTLSALTDAVLRDYLSEAYEGTLVLEEADRSSKMDSTAYELALSNRISRSTSKGTVNRQNTDGGWSKAPLDTFGATLVHRRIEFADAALTTRCIVLCTRPNHKRKYRSLVEQAPVFPDLKLEPLPRVNVPDSVGGRVADNYRPLLGVASLIGDEDFITELTEKLLVAQKELQSAQDSEPIMLILAAIVGKFSAASNFATSMRVADIKDMILQESGFNYQPKQISASARRLGLRVKVSNGYTVICPDPVLLVKACDEYGYAGEDVDRLRTMGPSPAVVPSAPVEAVATGPE